ncbi:MAG: phosphatidylglycerophosphatase A [Pseudomonadota bacterium]|nr:phosphatidylglycerophosphatase A [Pseudomonadota bacterium]
MTQTTASARVPNPPPALILSTPEHFIAFGFGAGLAPKAPGTMGSLVGVLLFLPLWFLNPEWYALVTAMLFVIGCWFCGESARLLGVHDYGGIVFDEIVGLLVAAAPLVLWPPASTLSGALLLAAAFALFRLFDIWKPWPIRVLDRHVHGGFGIMVDDLLAGVFAAVVLGGGIYLLR